MTSVIKGDSNVNLDFSTGERITGDFSNATLANRVFFQNSVINGASDVAVIPNGTSQAANFTAFGSSSDQANTTLMRIGVNSTETLINSFRTGTGSYLPMTFYTGGSERMRVDTSGNVGIGTSSPVNRLDVLGDVTVGGFYRNADVTVVGTAGMLLNLGARNGSVLTPGAAIGAQLDNPSTTGSLQFLTRSSNALTERARIDSSGNLLVGTTGTAYGGGERLSVVTSGGGSGTTGAGIRGLNSVLLGLWNSTVGSSTIIGFAAGSSGAGVGSITTNGTSTVAYNTSSDYRLKENVQPMTGALAKIAALKPVTYKWKVDGSDGQGFIAHELQEVVPDCVNGKKDAVDAEGNPVYQGIDTSFLVATLTAAIQELKAINDAQAQTITALTARVTALDTRLTSLEGTQP